MGQSTQDQVGHDGGRAIADRRAGKPSDWAVSGHALQRRADHGRHAHHWEGTLKRAASDLWDREDCDPAHAPDLWEDINYHDGVRVIPDVFSPGLAFDEGELGWWPADGNVYESQIPDNVTQPAPGDERFWKRV